MMSDPVAVDAGLMEVAGGFMEELFGANWEIDTGSRARKVRDGIYAALAAEKARADEAEAKWKAAAEAAVRRQREVERLTIANKNLGKISHENRERADAAEARCDTLAGALADMERANEAVAAARPHQVYLSMIDAGMEDVLLVLDNARRAARAALATIPAKPDTETKP